MGAPLLILCAMGTLLVPHAHVTRLRTRMSTVDKDTSASNVSPSAFEPGVILYTKQDCPLCEGLEINLRDLQQHVDFTLSKRWIEDDAEWRERYQYEVPVLVGVTPAGGEMDIPRPSPRASGVFLLRWLRKYYFEKLAQASAQDTPMT